MDEIAVSMEHNAREVSPHLFNQILIQHAKEEQKHVVYYMYSDDTGPTVTFKALSMHPIFQEDCVFITLKDPPTHLFEGLKKEYLPSIGVVEKLDEKFEEGSIKQTNIQASQPFNALLVHVAKYINKMDQLNEYFGVGDRKPRQNKRTFGEITNDADFKERCIDHRKGCAIGLLPANTMIDYEKENFDQHINILSTLDQKAKSMPIHYSWVNITCHPEWLKYFEID